MYVSSTAPVPQNSTSPVPRGVSQRYYREKDATARAVVNAALASNTSAPADSFARFGPNLHYQVERANRLVNAVGRNVPSGQLSTDSTSTTDLSDAPVVVPFNQVELNPPKEKMPGQGLYPEPAWGDSPISMNSTCRANWGGVQQWMAKYPWLALGIAAAGVMLITSSGKGRR